ncbi:MAG: hypothetical protein CMJ81_18205 [Planctomycetaceae bacterium]|nr:hypothetical protein [Planctomycetaceae bacterium]MBP60190.1 hypothetical protein [Planctomycetaceae bacterium]
MKLRSTERSLGDRGRVSLLQILIAASCCWVSGARQPAPIRASGTDAVTEREMMMNIFRSFCTDCHGKWKQEAGLDLRTRESMLAGGKSGPALVPGEPQKSLVYLRVNADEMPPRKNLFGDENYAYRPRADDIEKLRAWIAAGAATEPSKVAREHAAAVFPSIGDEGRDLWAFQLPRRPAEPDVHSSHQLRTPIDAFVLRRLESRDLSYSAEADRLVLMRRAYFDLIGLPPSPGEMDAYLADVQPDSYERMIQRLLDSRHYGERWGKYWLDAAGYCDTQGVGGGRDEYRKYIWRYRDYVIRSINADKPYDQFLLEQIAGDECVDYKSLESLTPDQVDKLIATGFLRTAADGTDERANNKVPNRMRVLNRQIEIFSTAVLGLTFECARCHDHKFDPITQRDYYSFAAIFRTAYDPYDWRIPNVAIFPGGISIPKLYQRSLYHRSITPSSQLEEYNAALRKTIEEHQTVLDEKTARFSKQLQRERLTTSKPTSTDDEQPLPSPQEKRQLLEAIDLPEDQRNSPLQKLWKKYAELLKVETKQLEERYEDYKKESPPLRAKISEAQEKLLEEPMVHALFDMGGEPTAVYVLKRGDPRVHGEQVSAGVPGALQQGLEPYQVIKPSGRTDTSGRRLALARWLVQPDHPLTARVMVNRIWQHHFGRALVTPDNLGSGSEPPSHPLLLDWLAKEFVRQGWKLKEMHRLIMTSGVYRQNSLPNARAFQSDPDNVLLSRFPLRRLDAETIRDSLLHVSGQLDTTPFGPADEVEVVSSGEVISHATSKGFRRSIYMMQLHAHPLTMLELFDAPAMLPNCLYRTETTVPTQALYLWNSAMVRNCSTHFSEIVLAAEPENVDRQIELIYRRALVRLPTPHERQRAQAVIADFASRWQEFSADDPTMAHRQALMTFCHAVLNSPEFIYVD